MGTLFNSRSLGHENETWRPDEFSYEVWGVKWRGYDKLMAYFRRAVVVEKVKSITSENVLDMLLQHSATVESIPTFEQKVAEVASKNGFESASNAPSG